MLASVAGVLGVAFAVVCQRLILAVQPPLPVTLALGLGMDLRVLLFALLLSLATGRPLRAVARAARLACPARRVAQGARRRAAARRRFSARDALVVAQVAGSLVLLVAAGLFLRSLANARAIDAGFDPEGALVFSLDLGAQGYDAARGGRFYTALQERLEHVPGVEAVGLATCCRSRSAPSGAACASRATRRAPARTWRCTRASWAPATSGRCAVASRAGGSSKRRTRPRHRRRDRQRGLRSPLLARAATGWASVSSPGTTGGRSR